MDTDDELLEKAFNLAFRYEAEKGSCPQCVLSALYETLEVSDPKTIQACQGLAGGTSLTTEGTCGALVGGILAIGSVVGRTYEEFSESKSKSLIYKYTKELYDKFVDNYGSCLCKDVQKKIFGKSYNLLDAKDYEKFEKAGAHVDKCPKVSGDAAKWAAEIIIKIKSRKKILWKDLNPSIQLLFSVDGYEY